jgi:glycerate kinase
MKIVVAMDSFKDSLPAPRACDVVAQAIASVTPSAEIIVKPMADGGEGTAEALIAASSWRSRSRHGRPATARFAETSAMTGTKPEPGGNGQWIEKTVMGPLPDMQVGAGFAWFPSDKTAVVEMAAASGLPLLPLEKRNPLKTTTYGTGQLIAAAIEHGAGRILLAVGGSATVDGGVGAAMALGWKFLDRDGREVGLGGGQLHLIDRIVPATQPIRATVEVLCDVDNPLCGEHGAAKVYGPQKGATEEMVQVLEKGLSHLARVVHKKLGRDIADVPGAGAAGGLAAGALAFMDARLVSGIDTVMAQSRLAEALAGADWVITGEGRFDEQSLRGKVVAGVARLAKTSGSKVAVLAGQVLLESGEYQDLGIVEAMPCMNSRMPLQYAMQNSDRLLAETAKRFAQRHLCG